MVDERVNRGEEINHLLCFCRSAEGLGQHSEAENWMLA